MIPDPHSTFSPHFLPFSLPLLSFPLPFLPPAHAKEALELARMQEQTAQVKHHEEFKGCVCVCVRACVRACMCACMYIYVEG